MVKIQGPSGGICISLRFLYKEAPLCGAFAVRIRTPGVTFSCLKEKGGSEGAETKFTFDKHLGEFTISLGKSQQDTAPCY